MQRSFPFLSAMQAPRTAKYSLVMRCAKTTTPEASAVAVSLIGVKAAYVAAQLGISAPYLSEIRKGKKPVPDWMVKPFVYLVGSQLLQQVRDHLQDALLDAEAETAEQTIRRLAAELRGAA